MKTLLAESAHPRTAPSRLCAILDEISRFMFAYQRLPRFYRQIEQNVTAHPNVPLHLLIPGIVTSTPGLIWEYPEAFLRNPIAPLLPLERPGFIEEVGRETMLRLLAYTRIPTTYINLARGSADAYLRDAAENHVQYAGELVAERVAWKSEIHRIFRRLPHYSSETDAVWALIESIPRWHWMLDFLKTELPWCRKDPPMENPWSELRAEAGRPETPVQRLREIAETNEIGVWSVLLRNPAIPEDLRCALRGRLPGYPISYREYFGEPRLVNFLALAQSHSGDRPKAWFITDEPPEFPVSVNTNPLEFPYPTTRLAFALNPMTPRRIRTILATKDGHRLVRAAAQASLKD